MKTIDGAVEIDGSQGEGGGQILRTSLTLSVLTGKPVEIARIRAGRSKPGLQPQHLAAVRAAAAICGAETHGDAVGSVKMRFAPRTAAAPGRYFFDIGTAGAATLVAQTVLLPLALAGGDSEVTVRGGTHVPHSPTADYLERVYGATLAAHGLECAYSSPDAGFFPRGGGTVRVTIPGTPNLRLTPIDMPPKRGPLISLYARVLTARLPSTVGIRGANATKAGLESISRAPEIEIADVHSAGPGAAVVIVATCDGSVAGFSAIGERGKPMEEVAEEACAQARRWWESGAACDERGADQWVLPMALTPGVSRWSTPRVTEHLRTVIWTAQQFLPIEAELVERTDGTGSVTLRGAAVLQ